MIDPRFLPPDNSGEEAPKEAFERYLASVPPRGRPIRTWGDRIHDGVLWVALLGLGALVYGAVGYATGRALGWW